MITMAEAAKRLAPSSWAGVAVWAVLAVVFVSAPVESARFVASSVIGTGRWIGYTAFADCEDAPPYGWMAAKECPVEVDPVVDEVEAGRP